MCAGIAFARSRCPQRLRPTSPDAAEHVWSAISDRCARWTARAWRIFAPGPFLGLPQTMHALFLASLVAAPAATAPRAAFLASLLAGVLAVDAAPAAAAAQRLVVALDDSATRARTHAVMVCSGLMNRAGRQAYVVGLDARDETWLEAAAPAPRRDVTVDDFLGACLEIAPRRVRYDAAAKVLIPLMPTIGGVLDAVPLEDGDPLAAGVDIAYAAERKDHQTRCSSHRTKRKDHRTRCSSHRTKSTPAGMTRSQNSPTSTSTTPSPRSSALWGIKRRASRRRTRATTSTGPTSSGRRSRATPIPACSISSLPNGSSRTFSSTAASQGLATTRCSGD